MGGQPKQFRRYYNGLRKDLYHYGETESKKLAQAFVKALIQCGDAYCNDNWRWCDLSNLREVETYKKARSSGCCGYHDEIVVIGHRSFSIGFNYGH